MIVPTPTQVLVNALERDRGGLAIVIWPSLELRAWLIDEVAALPAMAEGGGAVVVKTVDDALSAGDRPVLLVPEDERVAVDDLDGSRDQFAERSYPLVLFLYRDGDGERLLPFRPSLASWARGSRVDPDQLAEVDLDAERKRFFAEVGEPPMTWLEKWHARQVPRDGAGYARAYWAELLCQP
jgi:hypothetical protein